MNIKEYGFQPEMAGREEGMPARVTAVHKERYEIVCEFGETHAKLKTSIYYKGSEEFPTTGDFVMINYNHQGDSQIIKTLPRRTFFSRKDPTPGRGEQAVAANFDYVFVVQSLNHDFNIKRMERYLTLAWQSGAVPIVILTKADLVEDHARLLEEARRAAPFVDVHAISAYSGFGMEALEQYLQPGKTIVFLGSSGVGKSSLVNAFAGEEIMTVNGIRENDSKGRHTTTHRQLIRLKTGAMIIDTPGMRELGMWDVSIGLGSAFADVEEFLGKCRFADCRHEKEPGCAVKAAIASGELSRERWDSYILLKKEAKYSEDKGDYIRQKQQWHKEIAKKNRQRKSNTR